MKKKPAKSGLVSCVVICDRLPLEDGRVLVRDEAVELTETEATNYEAAGRVERN
jgi:hypothetical protein